MSTCLLSSFNCFNVQLISKAADRIHNVHQGNIQQLLASMYNDENKTNTNSDFYVL